MGMWLLTCKDDEDEIWPHGIYDNLEALETELRCLDSQGHECYVFLMPEVNAVNIRGPEEMFQGSWIHVDHLMGQLRRWESYH